MLHVKIDIAGAEFEMRVPSEGEGEGVREN